MSEFTRYTIKSEDLTETQAEIILKFDFTSGQRALDKGSYSSVVVGFCKGDCFHVAFNS